MKLVKIVLSLLLASALGASLGVLFSDDFEAATLGLMAGFSAMGIYLMNRRQ